MNQDPADLDRRLCQALCEHPRKFDNRYTYQAQHALLETLFRSLTNDRADYLDQLFPRGFPQSYRLQDAQEVNEQAEYNAGARGTLCGHIFKQGEVTYHCQTCTDDPTAVLCARCFASSNHDGHQLHISISSGNSGCCDCGDEEAWKRPVNCAIHTATDDFVSTEHYVSALPQDLQTAIKVTISRVLDYFCDVVSCSPENLRVPKTIGSALQDEQRSRLLSKHYGIDDEAEQNPEFCLLIWNDEKHTIREVQHQVARACHERLGFGIAKADEANDYGRSVVRHSRDLKELIQMAKIIEEIKITVTIRSSRDTFREQMCGTIIEWLSDIAGATVGNDSHILRRSLCEEMLQLWRVGSQAWNVKIGREQLDIHGIEDSEEDLRMIQLRFTDPIQMVLQRAMNQNVEGDDDLSDDGNEVVEMVQVEDVGDEIDDDDDDQPMANTILQTTTFQVDHAARDMADNALDPDATDDADEMDTDGDGDFLDLGERNERDQLPPATLTEETAPAPMATPMPLHRAPTDPPLQPDQNPNFMNVGKPQVAHPRSTPDGAPLHWMVSRASRTATTSPPVYEDLSKNIRIDSMILFDLRLWKVARTSLRDLYISTVVKIPQFKRILGLRFSGLYTTLAQLFLIADREPDHSIINLSLQILTTPSICQEVIERGNFLTNLMAILYTFLTTKQVGYPRDVDPGATLAFDAGSVANRRLYHFFSDLRYFLASSFVQAKVRADSHFLTQYLDLVKLLQGICPNVRAVGEHVEYETDAWISAALLTREVNKLCRQFAETFQITPSSSNQNKKATYDAISLTAAIAIVNSFGLERKRFEHGEIKDVVRFHTVHSTRARVVDFAVERGSLSFHHPIQYTLSWLLEGGKQSKESIVALKSSARNVLERLTNAPLGPKDVSIKSTISSEEDALMVLFDYPLRVCAWLAQMKANMWVRNGMSLRHQMGQYRSVPYRDVAHQRDLFLLQTALVACDPSRILVSMVDRFGLSDWMFGKFESLPDCEDGQMVDLAEDLIFLLINLLSDRDGLTTDKDDSESCLSIVRKEIAHGLCFKPLSYTDLTARLTERVQDHGKLQEVLETMTKFRPPEGMNDVGLYELKEEYLNELDPYNSHFSKNQRDEAESIYKKWMGKKIKKDPEDVVLEPKLCPITSEAYQHLTAIVHSPVFAEIIYRTLAFVAGGYRSKTGITATRMESFLQSMLQLALIATLEDNTGDDTPNLASFVHNALYLGLLDGSGAMSTMVKILHQIWLVDDFSACRSKIRHVLRLFNQKRPREFVLATQSLNFPSGRFDTASPANMEGEIEAKKKQAMERKAKVMASFQQQQQNFMDKSGFDWDDEELATPDAELPASTESRSWKYPSGQCIQCREDTTDSRLYGTFAMITDGHILRETPSEDSDWVDEVFAAPNNLDRSLEDQRPFGVSGSNREYVSQLTSTGEEIKVERQGLSKGWPQGYTKKGPLTTSCGHIMHFACYENYYQSVHRRHSQQVARNHPERVALKEFVCPLCKALANAFLPIVWKSTEQAYPGSLETRQPFLDFLDTDLKQLSQTPPSRDGSVGEQATRVHKQTLSTFANSALTPAIELSQAVDSTNSPPTSAWAERPELAPFTELTSVCLRLKDPLAIIARSTQSNSFTGGVPTNHYSLLLETLSNTIAAAEIAHRGREAEFGTSLLSAIPQQTLSHLQILSSTVRSYSATCAMTVPETIQDHYRDVYHTLVRQLFGQLVESETPILDEVGLEYPPLLCIDSFSFLTEATMVLCPLKGLELRHILRISLTAELIRVLLHYVRSSSGFGESLSKPKAASIPPLSSPEAHALEQTLFWIESRMRTSDNKAGNMNLFYTLKDLLDSSGLAALFRILRAYALTFMRKAALLFHVAHRVDLPTTAGSEASLPELDRLLHFMQLPSISEILMDFSEFSPSQTLRRLASAWIWDWDHYGSRKQRHGTPVSERWAVNGIRLLHPAPLELIGLPKYYDVLIELSSRKKCPTTSKELTDPALCLFCGEIFCSQTVCCMTREHRGGCNAHVEKCSSPIGMFLFIRKCHVVLLHVAKDPKMLDHNSQRRERGLSDLPPGSLTLSHGSFFPAPYMTRHGETDSGLRSKQMLELSRRRYERGLRDIWLLGGGGVWSAVARKLEGEVNAGGWETL